MDHRALEREKCGIVFAREKENPKAGCTEESLQESLARRVEPRFPVINSFQPASQLTFITEHSSDCSSFGQGGQLRA